jgi:hypothetical protein
LDRSSAGARFAVIVSWTYVREQSAVAALCTVSLSHHPPQGLSPESRPHTREQNPAILDRLELTGDFWRLP